MDDFLRESQTVIFKEWVLSQTTDYYDMRINEKDHDVIIIENEHCYSYITFNPQSIIELCVMNKSTDDMEFYLHFQFKTLEHAKNLFEEMRMSIKKIIDQPKCRILICCSGGMTSSFFANKMNEAIKILGLNMEVSAVGYQKLYQEGQNYDMILLAPQVSYVYLQVQKVLKNKTVLKIPTQVFAKYDVKSMIAFIDQALEKKEKQNDPYYIEPLETTMNVHLKGKVLVVSINANGDSSKIAYRLYDTDQSIILDSKIIKSLVSLNDVIDVLDTILLQNEGIEIIGISLPGVVKDGVLYSGMLQDVKDIQIESVLKERYHQDIVLMNDVNAAAVGFYSSHHQPASLSFLFQPIGRFAGVGSIVNGQLIRGFNGLAGEIQLIPLALSEDLVDLSNTPEGCLELVSKEIISIISIISPETIVLFSDLIYDVEQIKERISRYLERFNVKTLPEIIKVESLQEYILLGTMVLCG